MEEEKKVNTDTEADETIDDRKFSEKIKDRAARIKVWWQDNWATVAVVAAAAVPAVIGAGKEIGKLSAHHEEKMHRSRDFYDPRTGRTYRCKRKPKIWEEEEIQDRWDAGESYVHILRDMNLI